MKTKYAVSLIALILAAAFCGALVASRGVASARPARADESGAASVEGAAAAEAVEAEPALFQSPFPDKTCVGVPGTRCCTRQVFKQGNGERHVAYDTTYECDTGKTLQGTLTMKVSLQSGGATCDPMASLIPN